MAEEESCEPLSAEDRLVNADATHAAEEAVGAGVPFGGNAGLTEELVAGDAEAEAQPESVDEAVEPERQADSEQLTAEPVHLERKHLLGIRWMHWVNFPVLFTMIWSGLLIYWNDSDNAYEHPHRVYRVGLGSVTLFRFFPDWFYTLIHAQYNVTKGLGYHFFFMWIFALNGIAYVVYLLVTREWKFMVPDRKSLVEALQVTLIDLHLLKRPLPFQTKYNGAQKIAYTSIIVMGFGSLVTGLAIYKPTSTHWVTQLLGGYEMARWLHFWLTIGFVAFFFVHIYQVAAAGWNNFRAMVTGYELRRASEPSLDEERRKF